MRYIDISRTINVDMEKYPSDPDIVIESVKSLEEGNSCNLKNISLGSHTGTHIDAPRHIYKKGRTIDKIDLRRLICDVFVTVIDDFPNTALLKGFKTKGIRGILFKRKKSFQGLAIDEAKLLVSNGIDLVGTEETSIEESRDKTHPVHRFLLSRDVIIVEGLYLKKVKQGYYKLLCLPLKIGEGDGAPSRAVLLDDKSYNI